MTTETPLLAVVEAKDIRAETERWFLEADYHGTLCRCCERVSPVEGIFGDVSRQAIYATDPMVERGLLDSDERDAFLDRITPLALAAMRRVIIDELAIAVGGREAAN